VATTRVFGKGFAQKVWADKAFATLSEGRQVTLVPGVITLAGQTLEVVRGSENNISLVPGVITLAGQTVEVSRGRTVDLTPAMTTLTGGTVAVLFGGLQLELVPGQIALLGVPLTVSRGRTVELIPALVTLAGQTMTIERADTRGWLSARVIVLPQVRVHANASGIYLGNDAVLQLQELVDRNDVPVTTATVTLDNMVDENGDAPSGLSFPMSLQHAADGTYEARLPYSIGLTAGRLYKATVRAVSSSIVAEFTETVLAMRRAA
jgi:hypothetical protein